MILRVLYRMYFMNAAVKHWLMNRVTVRAWGLCSAAIVSLAMLVGNPVEPLFGLLGLLFAIIFISWLYHLFRRAHVSATRDTPRYATVDEDCTYPVKIKNQGKDITHFSFVERTLDPRPSWPLFSQAREPYEKQRNAFDRFFRFHRWLWLLEKKTSYATKLSTTIPHLKTHQEWQTMMQVRPLKRGIITLHDLRIILPDPLGLFLKIKKVSASENQIIILPKRYPVEFHLHGAQSPHQHGGDASAAQLGKQGEFTALRDYQVGDSMRSIHWKSWAKTGKLAVKEMEENFFPKHALVLDTSTTNENLFEQAVRVAATILTADEAAHSLIDLLFLGDRNHITSASHSSADSLLLLEALASVQMTPQQDVSLLMQSVLSHSGFLSSCICIFSSWSEQRANLISQFTHKGMQVTSFLLLENHSTMPENFHGHLLRENQIEEDLRRIEIWHKR